jgi:HEAT repeat protein
MAGCNKEGNSKRQFFHGVFSKEYSEREKTYMNEELTIAIDELRERPSDKTWFIPILINESCIPARRISNAEDLSHLQAIMLHEDWDTGIDRILRVLKYEDPVLARIWQLIALVEGPFEDERLHAIQQLSAIRTIEKLTLSALVRAADTGNTVIRKACLDALGKIGPDAAEAVPTLVAALNDPEDNVRQSAAEALGMIGPNAAPAVPALVAALNDPEDNVRQSAASALGKIGPNAAPAVATLVAALNDPDGKVALSAASALGKIGSDTAEAVPALVAALNHPSARWTAAPALARFGLDAVPAVPALAAGLNDPTFALFAFGALQVILKAFRTALNDPDDNVRRCAAEALGKIGPNAWEQARVEIGLAQQRSLSGQAAGDSPR